MDESKLFMSAGRPLTKEQQVLYNLPQRELIGLFSQKIALIDPTISKIERTFMVVTLISEPYHDWFYGQISVMVRENFRDLYLGKQGPENLFRELFPGEEIDDFLRKLLKTQVPEPKEEKKLSLVINAEIKEVIETDAELNIHSLAV
jgi:hypothetical protein